jgi:hypothetical protein
MLASFYRQLFLSEREKLGRRIESRRVRTVKVGLSQVVKFGLIALDNSTII